MWKKMIRNMEWLLIVALLVGVVMAVGCGELLIAPDRSRIETTSPPVARAGDDQNVVLGNTVTLNASGSNPGSGGTSLHSATWTFDSVPVGSSLNATAFGSNNGTGAGFTISFTPDVAGIFVVSLVVNDGQNSTPDSVNIIVSPIGSGNTAPVANAGTARAGVSIGSQVLLNGSATDADTSDLLVYHWTLANPPTSIKTTIPTLYGADTPAPYFTPVEGGTYTATLIVNDGKVDSAPASVTIGVDAPVVPSNIAPVADAGPAQNVFVGDLVTLSGSMSSDGNGNALTYSWTLTPPSGSVETLTNANTVSPTFTPNLIGDYVATLIVNDGMVNSAADTVTISAAAPAGGGTPAYVTSLINILQNNTYLVSHITAAGGLLEVLEFGQSGPGGSMTYTSLNPYVSSASPHLRREGSTWNVTDNSGYALAFEAVPFAGPRYFNFGGGAPVDATNTLTMPAYSSYWGLTGASVETWIKVAAVDSTTFGNKTFTGPNGAVYKFYTNSVPMTGTYDPDGTGSVIKGFVWNATAGNRAELTYLDNSGYPPREHIFLVKGVNSSQDPNMAILTFTTNLDSTIQITDGSFKKWTWQ